MDEQNRKYDRVMRRIPRAPVLRPPVNEDDYRSIFYNWPLSLHKDARSTSSGNNSSVAVVSRDTGHGQPASSNDDVLSAPNSEGINVDSAESEFVVRCRPVSLEPVAQDLFTWCKPSVRRPCAISRSPSIEIGFPNEGRSNKDVAVDLIDLGDLLDGDCALDDTFVRHYDFP